MRAVRFVVAALIWILTWIAPLTYMTVMAWGCENDARRFAQRVTTHYANDRNDIALAIARADRHAGGNKAVSVARGLLVVVSVAIPLVFIIGAVLNGTGPLGVNVPDALAALFALALVIGVSVAAIRC